MSAPFRQRTMLACLKAAIADQQPEYAPTYTLDRQVAQAINEMSPERLAALQAEWDAPREGRA